MQISKTLSNRYYVCLKGKQEVILWQPIESEYIVTPDCAYFGKVFRCMEQYLKINGLVFYLTWNLNELPSYGKNVVAVVLGDEWCRIPMYANKVLAVFKCYGTQLTLGCNLLATPSYLNFLSWMQFQRAWLSRLPGLLNHNFHSFQTPKEATRKTTTIYDLPLGYYKQLEIPIKNIKDRQYDIYFAGSLTQKSYSKTSLKYWFGEPKSLSRQKMISNIRKIEQNFPNTKIKLSLTQGFHDTSNEEVKRYSEDMMETKICPIPRGTSLETYRFFEAMRAGCIVITESLPSRWFYDESPAIKVNDWKDLEKVAKSLLENQQLMQKKHQDSLNWWNNKCSETAVGKYIATKLNEIN